MLTRAAPVGTGQHRRAVVASVAPTVRVAALRPAGATVALAALPALVAVAVGTADVGAVVVLAFVTSGAALGWMADDPAADLLAPLPVSAPVRGAVRALSALAVAVGGLLAVTAAVVAGNAGPLAEVVDRLPEATAAGAVALAVGFLAARRGDGSAGATGVSAGVLFPATVAALAVRWPGTLPSFVSGPGHTRWWLVAAAAAVVAARAGRDPGRR